MINWPGEMWALEARLVKSWGNPKCQEAEMSPPQKFFERYLSIRKNIVRPVYMLLTGVELVYISILIATLDIF